MSIQAFPGERLKHVAGYLSSEREPVAGMTLRDYFAAKAMQAYINAHPGGSPDHRDAPDWVPTLAYEMADAMLSEREQS